MGPQDNLRAPSLHRKRPRQLQPALFLLLGHASFLLACAVHAFRSLGLIERVKEIGNPTQRIRARATDGTELLAFELEKAVDTFAGGIKTPTRQSGRTQDVCLSCSCALTAFRAFCDAYRRGALRLHGVSATTAARGLRAGVERSARRYTSSQWMISVALCALRTGDALRPAEGDGGRAARGHHLLRQAAVRSEDCQEVGMLQACRVIPQAIAENPVMPFLTPRIGSIFASQWSGSYVR